MESKDVMEPRVVEAIERSWARETSAEPELWSSENPAKGHCDVSSFVAWEHFGGELVLSQVFVDGELSEHHYTNRIAGIDIDLTRSQFAGTETITEIGALSAQQVQAKQSELHPAVAQRIEDFRQRVNDRLG